MKYSKAKRALQQDVLTRALDSVKGQKCRVLCLPGKAGWDVHFFRQMSKVQEIVGLESEPAVFESIVSEHSSRKTKFHNMLTSEYLLDHAEPFDIVYLDYMANLSAVVRQDAELILRRKLVRRGGFLIVNIYGCRKTSSDHCAARCVYSDFCEAFGVPREEPDDFGRVVRLGWNSILGLSHLRLVTPKGHYVSTTAPEWKWYRTRGGRMYTASLRVNGYFQKPQRATLVKNRYAWLLQGSYRDCPKVEDPAF